MKFHTTNRRSQSISYNATLDIEVLTITGISVLEKKSCNINNTILILYYQLALSLGQLPRQVVNMYLYET